MIVLCKVILIKQLVPVQGDNRRQVLKVKKAYRS